MFLREVADSSASRSNEKAYLSQRQDPPLPSNRADLLYGADIHLSFCYPCLLCYSLWVERKSKESHPAKLIPTGTGGWDNGQCGLSPKDHPKNSISVLPPRLIWKLMSGNPSFSVLTPVGTQSLSVTEGITANVTSGNFQLTKSYPVLWFHLIPWPLTQVCVTAPMYRRTHGALVRQSSLPKAMRLTNSKFTRSNQVYPSWAL